MEFYLGQHVQLRESEYRDDADWSWLLGHAFEIVDLPPAITRSSRILGLHFLTPLRDDEEERLARGLYPRIYFYETQLVPLTDEVRIDPTETDPWSST